jgi:Ca-activated chloride channel family protein
MRMLLSRSRLPALPEPQVLYVLLEANPAVSPSPQLAAPPVNLCIVMDRSTSMQGPRLDQVKAAVLQVIDSLREADTFSVVAFSDKAEVVIPAERGMAERTLSKAKVTTLHAQGGTEILQGLLCGMLELHLNLSPTAVNHLILLTDGQTYGDEDECMLLAMMAASDGISISGLGIGEEWNDKFLDELTSLTGGNAQYINSPQQVPKFIQDRVRGLSAAYAERLNLQVTLDLDIKLLSAFKVSPEAGPISVEEFPLRLGTLPKDKPLSILLKFLVPPTLEGVRSIARLGLYADIVSLSRRGERTTADVSLSVVKELPPARPPTAIIDALSKLSQYKLQERAWQDVAAGDVSTATRRLSTLGTRLLASGQTDLAKAALAEARRLEKTHTVSEEARKQLKYGTRALLLPSPAKEGNP